MDKDLFKDLYAAFEAAKQQFIDNGVSPVKIIDRFRGQPLNPEQFEYYDMPAIFIDRAIVWELDGHVYNGNLVLDFHIVTEPTWDTSNISTNKDAGLNYFTFIDQVRQVLDNFSVGYMSRLQRTADEPVDTGVVQYEKLGYKAIYYANSILKPHYEDSAYQPDATLVLNKALVKKI